MGAILVIFLILLLFAPLIVAAGIALLVSMEIVTAEEVRRWFKRKRGKNDGTTFD